jgi:hypothetical protein
MSKKGTVRHQWVSLIEVRSSPPRKPKESLLGGFNDTDRFWESSRSAAEDDR